MEMRQVQQQASFDWETATPRERNIWIAINVCGWKWYRLVSRTTTNVRCQLLTPRALREWNATGNWDATEVDEPTPGEFADESCAPEYTEDHADAFEMEEKLKERGLADDYGIALSLVICAGDGKIVEASLFDLAHATPEQRGHAAWLTLTGR